MNYKFLFNLLKTWRNSNQIQFFTEGKVCSKIPLDNILSPFSHSILYSCILKMDLLMTNEKISSVFLKYLELPQIYINTDGTSHLSVCWGCLELNSPDPLRLRVVVSGQISSMLNATIAGIEKR